MTTTVLDRIGRVCADLQQRPDALLVAMGELRMVFAEVRDGIGYLSSEQVETLRRHFTDKGQQQCRG